MRDRLQKFIEAWQAKMDKHYTETAPYLVERFGRYAVVEMAEGKRYWKIIVNAGHGRSVRAFIDKETGDIFKAASWAAPAKHARGSIMAEDFGMSCMTEYGPVYLRG